MSTKTILLVLGIVLLFKMPPVGIFLIIMSVVYAKD